MPLDVHGGDDREELYRLNYDSLTYLMFSTRRLQTRPGVKHGPAPPRSRRGAFCLCPAPLSHHTVQSHTSVESAYARGGSLHGLPAPSARGTFLLFPHATGSGIHRQRSAHQSSAFPLLHVSFMPAASQGSRAPCVPLSSPAEIAQLGER